MQPSKNSLLFFVTLIFFIVTVRVNLNVQAMNAQTKASPIRITQIPNSETYLYGMQDYNCTITNLTNKPITIRINFNEPKDFTVTYPRIDGGDYALGEPYTLKPHQNVVFACITHQANLTQALNTSILNVTVET
jgi:hypothetical protein